MGLQDYLRIARARWKVIVGCIIATMAAAALLTYQATPIYSSSARLFVSTTTDSSSQVYQGSLFSAERITSYADLVGSRKVAGAVVNDLGLDMSPSDLAEKVTATVQPKTVNLQISVTDPSPRRAQRIAQSVAQQVRDLVAELETAPGHKVPPIEATIIDPASLPTAPDSPQPLRNLLLGTMLGLLLGFGVAMIREMLDVTVKDADDVAEAAEIPVMGNIAYDPTAVKRPLVTALDSYTPRVEAFRVLRTNMQFVDVDHDSRIYTVTSSVPEEGKTTTATNLAIMLAQAGQNVLLIEGDLRRPRIHVHSELERAVGLTTVLVGRMPLDEAVQRCGVPNLSVLTSGALPPNPAELLQSRAMTELLAHARENFDLVIIDAPPLLPVTDAALLTLQSDGALLVVRHGKTTKEQLRHAAERIKAVGGRPLGAVLNMVPSRHGVRKYSGYTQEGYRSLPFTLDPVPEPRTSASRPDGQPGSKGNPGSAAEEEDKPAPVVMASIGSTHHEKPRTGAGDARVPSPRRPADRAESKGTPARSLRFLDTDSVEVVAPPDWNALIRRLGGDEVYHSLEYHRASVHLEPEGTVPVLLHHRGKSSESALPLLLRPLPQLTGWDATSAYGFGGPLSSAADKSFADAIDEWAVRNRLVASFLRYHPLLRNQRLDPDPSRVAQSGYTAVWDLEKPRDLLEGMHTHHRRAARKADRAGLQIKVRSAPLDLSAFRAAYELTMKRQHAKDFYYFPDPYWEALSRDCSRHLLLLEGVLVDQPVASILCFTSPTFLHYHLGASTGEGRRIGASNRLFLAAAQWGRDNGLSKFHLGGGVGASTASSLFEFKRRFDPASTPLPFYVGKWVHDSKTYAAMTGGHSTGGYFPPWRS